MASTKNLGKDPNAGNHMSADLMDVLDVAVDRKQSEIFKSTIPENEQTTLVALANAQGFTEAVQFLYNNLPKDLQHGWYTRRLNRGSKGAFSSGPQSSGGEGAAESSGGHTKRRSPLRRKTRKRDTT